jgi:hypothetical protein
MKSKSLVSLQETTMAKILGFGLGLFFALASSGYAADVLYHGSFCNPSTPDGQARYNQWGVSNLLPFLPLSVNCGGVLPFSAISTIDQVEVFVYDRDPFQDVSCTLRTVALDGTETTTSTRSSSGSGVDGQFLIFNPVPQGDTRATTINLQCTIPGLTLLGFSHVTTYRVITAP